VVVYFQSPYSGKIYWEAVSSNNPEIQKLFEKYLKIIGFLLYFKEQLADSIIARDIEAAEKNHNITKYIIGTFTKKMKKCEL